jgi:hypothetical protein
VQGERFMAIETTRSIILTILEFIFWNTMRAEELKALHAFLMRRKPYFVQPVHFLGVCYSDATSGNHQWTWQRS